MHKTNEPLISVIINCFNGEKFINKCVHSVLNQTYSNFEIIFFDNNSSDKSLKLIKSIKSRKIRVFKSKKKIKLYHARNKALKLSKGKFISILDIDDTWDKNKLKKQMNKICRENSEIIYSNYWIINQSKKIFSKKKLPNKNMTFEILDNYPICISTVLFKKKIFLELKGFDKNFEIIGDYDFFYKVSKKYKFSVLQEPLTNYLIHDENTTIKKLNVRISEMRKWMKINYEPKYRDQFEKINQKNLFFECNHHILNRNIINFFRSLKKITDVRIRLKLTLKLIYLLIMR